LLLVLISLKLVTFFKVNFYCLFKYPKGNVQKPIFQSYILLINFGSRLVDVLLKLSHHAEDARFPNAAQKGQFIGQAANHVFQRLKNLFCG